MTKKSKAYSLVSILIGSITFVLIMGYPLYLALTIPIVYGFIIIKDKRHLISLVRTNIFAVRNILLLMFLIGTTLPVLMASGALPSLIYYATPLMAGNNILIMAFVSATALSMLIGTAIGTLTILIPLFSSIAFQAGFPYPMIIGALLSGAYIGDRASPLSSGLHLISAITQTQYEKNIKLLIKSTIIPFLITLFFFYMWGHKMLISDGLLVVQDVIRSAYGVTPLLLFPLALMIVLIQLKVPISRVLALVMLTSIAIVFYKGVDASEVLHMITSGYQSVHPDLTHILKSNGLKQMSSVLAVITLSATLNGIFESEDLMDDLIEPFVRNVDSPRALIYKTALLSAVLSMVTCSQAMTALVTGKYMTPYFDAAGIPRKFLVMAIANVGLNIVALIPWNVNGLMIRQLTGVPTLEYSPFSIFLWLLTLLSLTLYPWWIEVQQNETPL